MASYSTNEFRGGLKIMLEGDPCTIIENEFVKPGKGQAFSRVKLRNLKTGRMLEKTFRSSENVEAADVIDRELGYLYSDGAFWHFMDAETYEQYQADTNAMGESVKWLKEQDVCQVTLWNGTPIAVEAPNFVTLDITETDPGLKGDTSGGGGKPATLETGAVVRVPLFVQIGEKIKVKENFKLSNGGGGINVSIALTKLQASVGYLGKISSEFKEILDKTLSKNKIGLIESKETKRGVAKSILLQTKDRDRVIFTYRGQNDYLDLEDFDYKSLNCNNFYLTALNGKSMTTQIKLIKLKYKVNPKTLPNTDKYNNEEI